jgi:tetratricopeptide (TPR) repeat protein
MDCETVERENIVERYLAGTLEPELKEHWERHYFGCDRCAGQLETWQAIEQPLRAMAASIRQEIQPREIRPHQSTARWLWAGAAIAAALLVGLGIKQTLPPSQRLPRPEISTAAPTVSPLAELARLEPPAYRPVTLRAAGSKAEAQFQKAMEAYLRRDYPRTIAGLQAALELDPDAPAPRFFLGACDLLTGNTADGVRELERVASGDSPFAQEAQFDLAKGYLLEGNQERALALLRRLADVPGDFRERARQSIARIAAIQ